jgi:hypothetical protein
MRIQSPLRARQISMLLGIFYLKVEWDKVSGVVLRQALPDPNLSLPQIACFGLFV